MKRIHFLLVFATVSLLAACEMLDSKSDNNQPDNLPLIDTTWWLQAFQDEKGKRSESTMDDIKLVFMESDTLAGKAFHKVKSSELVGSNSYLAIYSVDNASIEVKGVLSTYAGIPPGSRYTEYGAALDEASTYKIQGDRLIIFYGEDGDKALHFKAGEEVDL